MKFIYALKCPDEDVIRYVGKSDHPERRLRQHIKKAILGETTHHCARWIKRLVDAGKKPELVILCSLPDDGPWQAVERILIATAREAGMPLTNITAGGDGVVVVDPETLAVRGKRISEARARPGAREKCAAAAREAHSKPDTKRLHAEAIRKYWADPVAHARHVAALNTESVLAAKSQHSRAMWQDPVHAAKIREAMMAASAKPEIREKRSTGQKVRHADAEKKVQHRHATTAALSTPEMRAKISVRTLIGLAKPGTRSAHAAAVTAHWEKPDSRKVRAESLARPEVKAALSHASKQAWADPDVAGRIRAAQQAAWADPDKKEKALEKRNAMWSDPVKRAELIERQKAAWVKRKAAAIAA